jgi:GAF domain-containing protein
MSKVKYNVAINTWRGPLDSRKTGQAKRERLVSRYRKGSGENHQVYPMKMHEGPWAEGATRNRELMKTAQREAHAIERAALHPELATPEYLTLAAEWQKRFAEYKSTKRPQDKQFATLYTYTYSHLYRELKLGEVLDLVKAKSQAKTHLYQSLLPQIESLISGETDLIANMANIVAVLHNTFHFWWTGFYLVKEKDQSPISNDKSPINQELVLGPFQGPIACTRIPFGKGVCGTAWKNGETLIVPDVHQFPGHIACSSESKSEIVVPIRHNGEIIAVLDIDSKDYNTFDNIDKNYLEQIKLLA